MSEKLLVYFSLSGSTAKVASLIKDETDCDLLFVKPAKFKIHKAFLKYFIGGFQAIFKKTPKLKKYDLDLNNYSKIILGTPIWASHMSPAIRSFIEHESIENKKIHLFSCSYDKAAADKALTEMTAILEKKGNKVLSLYEFKEPILKDPDLKNKVLDFLKSF